MKETVSETPARYVLKKNEEKCWSVFNDSGSRLWTYANWQTAVEAVQALLRVHPFFEFKQVYCLSDAESVIETNFLKPRSTAVPE
jgi:hypothetical protein